LKSLQRELALKPELALKRLGLKSPVQSARSILALPRQLRFGPPLMRGSSIPRRIFFSLALDDFYFSADAGSEERPL